jgi:hypothetical protein
MWTVYVRRAGEQFHAQCKHKGEYVELPELEAKKLAEQYRSKSSYNYHYWAAPLSN